MIRLHLPDNFENNIKIDRIYDGLAQKIYAERGLCQITFTYHGRKKSFDSAATIKKFLMSTDFYDYKFEQIHGFMRDLINLSGQTKISSILNNTSKSEEVKGFCAKYNKSSYQKYYDDMKEYDQLTISDFKTKGTHQLLLQYKKICHIFDYDKLKDSDRHIILNAMKIPVCPYCNMNYTISFMRKDGVRSTADIDHFFLKSKYPEYALCLYNFVPACPVCNQKIKGTKSMTTETHIYPHQEGFEGKSHFQVTNLLELLIRNQTHAKIELDNQESNPRVEQSKLDFELDARYESFSYFAEDLIEKAQIYNETYAEILCESIDGLIDKSNIKNLIFGAKLSEEQYGRLSLGKLKQDILDQLGVFDA